MSDTAAAADLYAGISTELLNILREAFELDRAHSLAAETLAFCDGRLALIAAELQKRQAEPAP